MSNRNLDTSMAAALPNGSIMPAVLCELGLKSGMQRVWSGVGPLSWNSKTWSGLGEFCSMDAITEASAVIAEGTTVTLSGIGLSSIPVPPLGITPPSPPFTPPAGQSVAWAVAKTFGPPGTLFIPHSVFTGGTDVTGASSATATTGSIGIAGGDPFGRATLGLTWSDFSVPPEIPPGATITAVHAVVNFSGSFGFTEMLLDGNGIAAGGYVSPNLHTIGHTITATALSTLPGASVNLDATLVVLAVYYTGSPSSTTQLVYEALNDIRLGGPVKIWVGLMAGGSFIGTPYLVFRGTVDQPTVTTSPETGTSITLALENRLSNMQRASNRKYTSADQRIEFPDDIFFAFVEILQSIALREGIA